MPRARRPMLSLLAIALAAVPAHARAPERTTSYATVGGDASAPYSRLELRPGWKRVVRDDLATPRRRRLFRRRLLR